ncbi:MAG: OmpA family protein, partial [Cyclobacteriaceae bacterium]|nr:OmpA family protein [Cyclobacteriaceae bacterium]
MINLLSISFAFFSIFSGWAQSVTQKADEEFLRKSIFFSGGSYHIDDEQKENLSEFIKNVNNIENFEVIISGHTDNIGGKEFNEWLSEMRTHT